MGNDTDAGRSDRDQSAAAEVATAVAERLGVDAAGTEPLHGGSIGEVHRVDLADGRSVVAKRGDTPLSVEAGMLEYLGARGLPVPEVLTADDELLVLAHVRGDTDPSPAAERAIADELAALHEHSAPAFGFERDTLLGPLALPNPRTDAWIDLFGEHRLGHFADVAVEREAIDERAAERVAALAEDLGAILTEPEAPALLHGDVWRENVLVRDGEVAAFLDPACYYGHPEAELAYVRWTDAFGEPFFDRYRSHRPLAPGFEERARVYALSRILVHAICFGSPYDRDLDATLERLGY